MKPEVTNPVLKTWVALNEAMLEADENYCKDLIREEIEGRNRKQFIRRIHCRLNKVRAERERQELGF